MPIANVHEIKIRTSGFPGAPGWTTLYFNGDDPAGQANQFRAAKSFLTLFAAYFPITWTGVVLAEGRLILASTGFVESFTAAPADGTTAPVVGTGTNSYGAGVAGMVIGWRTAGLNRGRRVHGRTFLVPLHNGMYDADGTLQPGTIVESTAAATTWATGPEGFGIYSRPRLKVGGAFFLAVGASVRDKAAFLSSRRD